MIILITLLLSWAAQASECRPMTLESFTQRVESVKVHYFPEFRDLRLVVTTFRSDAYFLQAQPRIKTLFKKKSRRVYEVQLNTKLLDCPPTPAGLEAILVHELEHIRDFTGWSSARIIRHGV